MRELSPFFVTARPLRGVEMPGRALLGERTISMPMADGATLELEWLYEPTTSTG